MRRRAEWLKLSIRARRRGQAMASPVGMSASLPLVTDIRTAQLSSLAWRAGASRSLQRRRRAATTALGSATVMTGLSLYQLGTIRRLPDLPVRGFDANRVDASAHAYQLLSAPDATLGVLSYASTAVLAGAGGPRPPAAITAALLAKATLDLGWAIKLTADQPLKHRAACSWCLIASALTVATFVAAAGEARARLMGRS